MTFSQQLGEMMARIPCSVEELSAAAGLSRSTISRYLSGSRRPKSGGDPFLQLCRGLRQLAREGGQPELAESIPAILAASLPGAPVSFEQARRRIVALQERLELSNADLARALSYDASMVSRILSGRRQPGNADAFLRKLTAFLAEAVTRRQLWEETGAVLGCDPESLRDRSACARLLMEHLTAGEVTAASNPVDSFLRGIDRFDLNAFLGGLLAAVPKEAPPVELPRRGETRHYQGLQAMMEAELGFQALTLAAPEARRVMLYSDMPMGDMSRDPAFPRLWMMGMARMLQRGIRMDIIHNVNRPWGEMMLGLENYIPMYMTGLISPYYLKRPAAGPFCHLLEVSEGASLLGAAVEGRHARGRYTLSANEEEIAFCRQLGEDLLHQASPLMDIYRANAEEAYRQVLARELQQPGTYRMICSSLPLATISPALLNSILERSAVPRETAQRICGLADAQRQILQARLTDSELWLEIPLLSREAFETEGISLALSPLFLERSIRCTYEEYRAHLGETMALAGQASVHISLQSAPAFSHIEILVRQDHWAVVSKELSPAIHFLIRHPRMVSAIAGFVPPTGSPPVPAMTASGS